MWRGNIFKDKVSPHYEAHKELEAFWQPYRRKGTLRKSKPTMKQYNKALYKSLQKAGLNEKESITAMRAAVKQQQEYGLKYNDTVPRIPRKINLK